MRKLSTGIAIAGLLNPVGAQALGVGDIRLQSYLNQALRAEIPLVLSQEKLSDIKIQLAPAKDFAAAGLERSYVLTKLRFEPTQKPDGGFVIRVGSSESIHEPFLNFLLELTWPDGRMVRNFTVLLDPPDVLAQPSAQPRSDRLAEFGDSPLDRLSPPPQIAAAVEVAPSSVSEYGPVGRNEKLWTIAGKLNRDPTISQEQMVIALFRLNPHAFSKPSVNALNAGALLKVPTRDYIVRVSPSLAREEFFRQQAGHTARWLREPPRTAGLQEETAAPYPEPTGTLGSNKNPPAAVPDRSAPNPQSDVGLRMMEALQSENSEMRVRLAELEKRVAELQVMFAEKELLPPHGEPPASLDGRTSSEVDADRTKGLAAQAPNPAGSREAANSSALPPSATATVLPSAANNPTPAKNVTPAPSDARQTAAPASPGGSNAAAEANGRLHAALGDQAGQEPPGAWLFVGAAASVGSLLTWLYGRRRRGAASNSGSEATMMGVPQTQQGEAKNAAVMPGEPDAGTVSETVTPHPIVDSEDVDPIFEADIYLSYGKHGQALETIRNALRQCPEQEAYRLKLLEIHLIGGDTEQFQQEVRNLKQSQPFAGQAFWDRVTELAGRLDAEKALDRALGVVTTKPDSKPAVDETDRLIDDLKQFSREMRGDPPKESAPTQTIPRAERLEELPDQAEESADAHEIPWVPIATGTRPESMAPPTEQSGHSPFAGADDPSHQAEPALQVADMPAAFETVASESIDSLLKELSALHYERHCKEDEAAPALGTASCGERQDQQNTLTLSDATRQQKIAPDSTVEPLLIDDDEIVPDHLETKLDLARAYADMGDHQQAREFLSEVMERGSETQRAEAAGLLSALAGA